MTDWADQMAAAVELKLHWHSEHDRMVVADYLRKAFQRGMTNSDALDKLRNGVVDLTIALDVAKADAAQAQEEARGERIKADLLRAENERLRAIVAKTAAEKGFYRKCEAPGCDNMMLLGAGTKVSGYANKRTCSTSCRSRLARARAAEKKEAA